MTQKALSNPLSISKPDENTWLWLLKLVTGLLIFGLLLIHVVVNHLVPATGLLTYHQVVAYYQMWFIPIMESCFLVLVVTHSLLGLRSIVMDLNPTYTVMKVVDGLFLLVGIVSVGYGLWLIQVIVSRGI